MLWFSLPHCPYWSARTEPYTRMNKRTKMRKLPGNPFYPHLPQPYLVSLGLCFKLANKLLITRMLTHHTVVLVSQKNLFKFGLFFPYVSVSVFTPPCQLNHFHVGSTMFFVLELHFPDKIHKVYIGQGLILTSRRNFQADHFPCFFSLLTAPL